MTGGAPAATVPPPDARLVPHWRWTVAAPTVLQVVEDLTDTEAARAAVDCARGLAETGGRALVGSTGGRLSHVLTRHGAEPVELPLERRGPTATRRQVEALAALARDHGAQILQARSRATAHVARLAAHQLGLPLITSVHEVVAPKSWRQRRAVRALARGDRVTAVSAYVGHHLQSHLAVPQNQLRRVPGGVDVDTLDPEQVTPQRIIQLAEAWGVPDDRKTVMLPARFEPGKGHRLLVEALNRLTRRDYVCLLVGAGEHGESVQNELAEMVESRALGDRVRLVSGCHDMAAAYMLADVVAAPATRPRPFGRVAAEAQAMGRPVIAADHGGPAETVRRGYTGWLVPPGDVEALAATLDQALDLNSDTRGWLGEQARAHIKAHYDRRLAVRRSLAVYDELMAHPGDAEAGQRHFEALVGRR